MKLDRLLAITMELMMRKRVKATDLAERFEVSVRTVYRDIETINQAGIPVASFTGAEGGFELMEGYFLTKQHFSLEDFSMIYQLLRQMDEAAGGSLVTLRHKLGTLHPALAKGEAQERIVFDLSTREEDQAVIRPLYQAIRQRKRVAFAYKDAEGTESDRKVEPLRLYWERGIWYMEAYCMTRQALRLFRVSRLSQVLLTDESYTPRDELTLTHAETPEGLDVHLRFSLEAQTRVQDQFGEACEHHETHIDVHTVVYSREYALSVALSYGTKVIIMEPTALRAELLEHMREIAALYALPVAPIQ
ncbi:helix-turn-helix transcriptional regulator [Paenibacillus daejeonensis]|uniref:helix-turn-helix transcriptional regulator n=1 Tax=Paenibacillus daejeonensis TaxID=135193 RepID=UPI0003639A7F|nr:YafY family protein [Paenibacillus daejeonensis]